MSDIMSIILEGVHEIYLAIMREVISGKYVFNDGQYFVNC